MSQLTLEIEVNGLQQPLDGCRSELDLASKRFEGTLALCERHELVAAAGVNSIYCLRHVVASL